jgi:hypothetical protein
MTMNIQQIVNDLLAQGDEVNIDQVAAQALASVPEGEEREVLGQVLTVYVRHRLTRTRNLSLDKEFPQRKEFGDQGQKRLQAVSALKQVPKGGYPSARVKAVAETWMSDTIHAGPQRFVRIAKATLQDLSFAAQELRTQASQNNAKAEKYEYLAELLLVNGVDTVEELPAQVRVQATAKVAA